MNTLQTPNTAIGVSVDGGTSSSMTFQQCIEAIGFHFDDKHAPFTLAPDEQQRLGAEMVKEKRGSAQRNQAWDDLGEPGKIAETITTLFRTCVFLEHRLDRVDQKHYSFFSRAQKAMRWAKGKKAKMVSPSLLCKLHECLMRSFFKSPIGSSTTDPVAFAIRNRVAVLAEINVKGEWKQDVGKGNVGKELLVEEGSKRDFGLRRNHSTIKSSLLEVDLEWDGKSHI